jgi:protocatechuate 3,4-dioxygenase beta subunit/uncharacterized GH25 family protein
MPAHRSISAPVFAAVALTAALLCALPTVADEPGAQPRDFELHVVGPDGKAVSEAAVQVRMNPAITAEQVQRGKLVKKQGGECATDASGVLVVRLPNELRSFAVFITTPGFGPYCARWQSEEALGRLPARFTAELEEGWSVAGTIVDSDGKPVAGAKLRPSIEFKKPPDDTSQLGVGSTISSDAEGKFRFDSVPLSKQELGVEFSHADFKPQVNHLKRGEFGIARDQQPAGTIVLDRGLTIAGRVTDEEGAPIAGAVLRTRFLNDTREAKTGEDGVYHLSGCTVGNARLVVWAKDKAMDFQQIAVSASMEPVDFKMKPGGTIRVRVLDEQGNPAPKARIFFQRWRGETIRYFEFDKVNQYTDKDGLWEWHEAPLEPIAADICPPSGMQLAEQPLAPREEEYVFKARPPIVIGGSVVDAETKSPIKSFKVTPGIVSSRPRWDFSRAFTATSGKYQVSEYRDPQLAVRIEADGYLPVVSRNVTSDEGRVTIDFELKKGEDVTAAILTPDGKPAAGAKIALGAAGSQIHVRNGDIDNMQTYAARTISDENGRFHFSPQSDVFQLIITHPQGIARVIGSDGAIPETITLIAWAKVEGTFHVGQKIGADVPVELRVSGLDSFGERGQPSIFSDYTIKTDKDGKFTFERVVPGTARIGREITLMVNEGATEVTSRCLVPIEVEAGKTAHIDLGGTGLPVVAKLEPPKGLEGKVNWRMATVNVQIFVPPLRLAPPPFPADVAADPTMRQAWLNQWRQTEAGKIWTVGERAIEANQQRRASGPYILATVDKDGSFRIDDVPEGDYSLSVRIDGPNGAVAPGQISNYQFQVPAADASKRGQEVNLGVLRLGK